MTTKRLMGSAVVLAWMLCNWAALAGTGYAGSYRGTDKPVMDGQLDGDPFWDDVPRGSNFRALGGSGKPAPLATWFKLAYTDEALYVGVWCAEPQMGRVKADAKSGGSVWTDDSVEIFIAPPSVGTYFQFVVNTAGARFNGEDVRQTPLQPWVAKCATTADAYSLEIRLPYTVLLAAPKAGACWVGNVGRNHYTCETTHSSWAALAGGFHDKPAFAPLFFPVGVDSPAAEARLRAVLHADLAGTCAELRTIVKTLDRNSLAARLLRTEYDALARQCPTRDRRALFRLNSQAEELLRWGQSLQRQAQATPARTRLARFF